MVNVEKLTEALTVVKPGLANKELLEQTTSFAFLKGKVVTYNDEISIQYPIEGLDIEGAIEATQLYGFVGKLNKEEIEYSVEEDELIFKSGRAKAGFTLQKEIKLPLNTMPERMKWHVLPELFSKYLNRAKDVCSNDMSRPMLTCVHVLPSGIIQASDSLRLIQLDVKKEIGNQEFLLPAKTAKVVVNFEPSLIGYSDGWVHFKREDGALLSCRIFEDKYVDFSKFIKVDGKLLHFPKTLKTVIEKAEVFSKRDFLLEEVVSLIVENKKLTVRSDSDFGWFEETLNMRYKGDSFSFQVAPMALLDILEDTVDAVITDQLLSFKTEDWVYVSAYTKMNSKT